MASKTLQPDRITVKVQRMFPNCQKYNKCCSESGMEELMAKTENISQCPPTEIINLGHIECSICGWVTEVTNFHGIKRHQEWHDPKQAYKHVSKNKVWGKVNWKGISK